MGRIFSLWTGRLLLFLPAVLLLMAAVPRFESGLAVDAAFPVPVYMVVNAPLPANSYRAAADVLAGADSRDGRSMLERAEAASMAGDPQAAVVDMLRSALAEAPASVRGWTLLAEQLLKQDPKAATTSLEHSLLLGRYEYFVAGKRARVAAAVWDQLSPGAREAMILQTRLLWPDIVLRRDIASLLSTPGGSDLMNRAFRNDPEQVRALNRWLAQERRDAAANR